MKMLFVGTHGSNDPTRAAMPLISATGALSEGHEVKVAFLGEAAYITNETIAQEVNAVAFGNVADRMRQLVEGGVSFYV